MVQITMTYLTYLASSLCKAYLMLHLDVAAKPPIGSMSQTAQALPWKLPNLII
jgi:hypothetical protein